MSDKADAVEADVLVLGLGPVGLGILRSLKKYPNIRNYGVVFNPRTERGNFTNRCNILRWTDPKLDEPGFRKSLIQWSENRKNVIVFATRDEEVFWLAKNADNLPSNLLYYRNSSEQVDKLANKILAIETARSCGVKVPMSFHVIPAYKNLPKDFAFPGIIKPSSIPPEGFPHKNMIVNDPEELESVLNTYPSLIDSSILQEYIPGGDDQMYESNILIGQSGKVMASVEFKKLRQSPPGRGLASFGHTLLNKEVSHLSHLLMRRADVKGPANFEFKKDVRDNRWVFIEVNLRSPAYASIFSCSDVNLTDLYVSDLLNQHVPTEKTENRKICYWMNEELDFSNVFTQKIKISFFEWLKDALRTDAFIFCDRGDIMTGIFSAYMFAKNIFNRYLQKLKNFRML